METLGVRAHEKGLELALRIPSTFPTALTGDPLRLRQILINLLGNAIKFTEHGEVTLTIDAVDSVQAGEALAEKPKAEDAAASADAGSPVRRQLLRFVVRDTGIGIPANQLQAIFSNFTQADSTISRRYGGSGLGLAIVKRLVELMNGRVAVESRPREGSSFQLHHRARASTWRRRRGIASPGRHGAPVREASAGGRRLAGQPRYPGRTAGAGRRRGRRGRGRCRRVGRARTRARGRTALRRGGGRQPDAGA